MRWKGWADSGVVRARVSIDGFSLHDAVRVEAHDGKRLEQLCRYITRPALSDERMQLSAVGQVELKFKSLARRHHAPGDEPAGFHAATGRAGATLALGLPAAGSCCPWQVTALRRPTQGSECLFRVDTAS